jgi:hypothetical protein
MNAVALGHLAILVGWTEEKVSALFRARAYLHFLEDVSKPTLLVRNLVIMRRDQAQHLFSPRESPDKARSLSVARQSSR